MEEATSLNPDQQNLLPVSGQSLSGEEKLVVSVLVQTYNHERFIVECLDAILCQETDFPVEIIVHDDASTDQTAKIIRQYEQRYPDVIRTILQKENQGSRFGRARPLMIDFARGKFIANCDGDDKWMDSRKLLKQVSCLEKNPDCILSYHNFVPMDEEGHFIKKRNIFNKGTFNFSQSELRVLECSYMLLGTVVHRNVTIEFPPEYYLVPNGDNFVPMLLAAHGGAKFQKEVEPLAQRKHSAGVWSMKSAAAKSSMHLQTYLQIASYFVRIGEVDSAKHILSGRLSKFIRHYCKRTGGRCKSQLVYLLSQVKCLRQFWSNR